MCGHFFDKIVCWIFRISTKFYLKLAVQWERILNVTSQYPLFSILTVYFTWIYHRPANWKPWRYVNSLLFLNFDEEFRCCFLLNSKTSEQLKNVFWTGLWSCIPNSRMISHFFLKWKNTRKKIHFWFF